MTALFPIFCTSEVSPQTLSQLLEDAYAEGPDSPDCLFLVHDKQTLRRSAKDNYQLQPTIPPVSIPPSSDFYGATLASLISHVQENVVNGQVSGDYFLVVNAQTARDKTVLVVKCLDDTPAAGDGDSATGDTVESVRVASSQANAPVVAMEVGCGSMVELKSNVDDDGVYRGGRGPAPKKGGPAPRMMLGGGR